MVCILSYIKSAQGKRLLYENKINAQVVNYSNTNSVGSPLIEDQFQDIVSLLEVT